MHFGVQKVDPGHKRLCFSFRRDQFQLLNLSLHPQSLQNIFFHSQARCRSQMLQTPAEVPPSGTLHTVCALCSLSVLPWLHQGSQLFGSMVSFKKTYFTQGNSAKRLKTQRYTGSVITSSFISLSFLLLYLFGKERYPSSTLPPIFFYYYYYFNLLQD